MELKISIKSYFESKESSSRVFFRAAGELQWKCSKKKKVFLLETILFSKYHLLEWTLPYIYIYEKKHSQILFSSFRYRV